MKNINLIWLTCEMQMIYTGNSNCFEFVKETSHIQIIDIKKDKFHTGNHKGYQVSYSVP